MDANETQSEDEVKLAPPDPEIDAVRKMSVAQPFLPGVSEPVIDDSKYQFRIWHIMLVMVIVALTLASLEWLPSSIVAGILGTLTLVSLVGGLRLAEKHPKLSLLWAVLLLMYLTIAIYLTVRYLLGF